MGSQASWNIKDFDGQNGNFAINTVPLTAANFAAQSGLLDTLRGETQSIIVGDIQAQSINIANLYLPSNAKAANELAQRGNKWRVDAFDNMQFITGAIPNPTYFRPFQYDVPTADLSKRVGNSNVVFQSGAPSVDSDIDDFVAAFEAVAKSPNGGALQVVTVSAVTRAGG